MRLVTINWNEFLKMCCTNYPNESCAFLFAEKPFSEFEKWHVFPVANNSSDPTNSWIPDKSQMAKVKKKARAFGLTKIGNIHSHPIPFDLLHKVPSPGEEFDIVREASLPSELDLKFARKFNDTIRGILVVGPDAIYHQYFHDQFGKQIHILTNEVSDELEQ